MAMGLRVPIRGPSYSPWSLGWCCTDLGAFEDDPALAHRVLAFADEGFQTEFLWGFLYIQLNYYGSL